MRLRKFLIAIVVVLIVLAIFCCGYTAGKNRTTKIELSVSIPAHVLLYQSIKEGNSNKAACYTGMILMGKITRYKELKNDWFFRITAGSKIFNSTNMQEYVNEARKIIELEKTNLVTIGPEISN